MSRRALAFRPGARAWQEELSCAPDPRVVVASRRAVARWLEGGAMQTRVYGESQHESVVHVMIAPPEGDPVWVPQSALSPAENEGYALLSEAATALGTRVASARIERTLPEESEWLKLGEEGEFVFFRRWHASDARATGPRMRAFAIDVLRSYEIPERVPFLEDEGEAPPSLLCPTPGAPTSAVLLERFLRRWDAMRELGLVLLEPPPNADFSWAALEGEEAGEPRESAATDEELMIPSRVAGDGGGRGTQALAPTRTPLQRERGRATPQDRERYDEPRDSRTSRRATADDEAYHHRTSSIEPEARSVFDRAHDSRTSTIEAATRSVLDDAHDSRTSGLNPAASDEGAPPNATPRPPEPSVAQVLQRAKSPAPSPLPPKPGTSPFASRDTALAPSPTPPPAPRPISPVARTPLSELPRLDALRVAEQPSSSPAPLDAPTRDTALADAMRPVASQPNETPPRVQTFLAPRRATSARIETAPPLPGPTPRASMFEPPPPTAFQERDTALSKDATPHPPQHAIIARQAFEAERASMLDPRSAHSSEPANERHTPKKDSIPRHAPGQDEQESPARPRTPKAAPAQTGAPPPPPTRRLAQGEKLPLARVEPVSPPDVPALDQGPTSPLSRPHVELGHPPQHPLPSPSPGRAADPLSQWLLQPQRRAESRPLASLHPSSRQLPIAPLLSMEQPDNHTLVEELVALPRSSAPRALSGLAIDRSLVLGEIIVELGVTEAKRRAPRPRTGSLIATLKGPTLLGRLR